ncbi:MAG: 50S ribosomal protein L32, partial [Clostridiales bacterium]|nr:50S ribosomal protein L32 [Clostridiales bacterium]
ASVSECPKCHEFKQNHRVCPHCGYYDGVQRVEVKTEKE